MNFLLKWRWELAAPFAGLLLTLAFAPFHFSYLAIVSLVVIFLSYLNCSPRRAALRGYLYGLGLFGSGVSWVYISIHDYGGAPVVGAILLTIAVVFFWSLFPALTAYLSVKLAGKKPQQSTLWIIPVVWVLIEYYRGRWFLNGFPWLQIAYSQLETPLQGFVPVTGVYGTGFFLAITASIIVAGINQSIKYYQALIVILLLWGLGGYLSTIQWTSAIGGPIRVALIQGNVAQDQKWLPENRIKTLFSYQQLTEQHWEADIIIWPETAIPAYLSQVKEFYLQPLSEKAREHHSDLIVSLPAKGKPNEYFNSVLTLGNNEGRYNKNHLLPFGEYLPWQPLSGFILDSLNIRLGSFTSGGDEQVLLKAGGYPFATSICYEDAFGEEAIKSMPEAAFLVNVTNDAWFGDSIEPHQHMQIAQMRALETGRYLLRVTNTGVTGIVAANGELIKKAASFEQVVLTGEILPMGGMTPYARLGDRAVIFLLLLCLVGLFIKSRV